jgi:hypothetical protein
MKILLVGPFDRQNNKPDIRVYERALLPDCYRLAVYM